MAELIVRLVDNVNPDPAEDLRSSWKRGHVIAVQEDGYDWGRKEDIRKWIASGETKATWHGMTALILIPGVPKADVEYLLQSVYDALSLEGLLARRRSWRAKLDILPQPVKNTLARDFLFTATKAQWDAVVEYVGL